MPYKSEEQRREAARVSMAKKRLTPDVNPDMLTPKGSRMLTRPNRLGSNGLPEMVSNDYNPDEMWQGTLRYLGPFTDGQVLDRSTVGGYHAS